MKFLKYFCVSILLTIGVYSTVTVVFGDHDFLDLVAYIFLFLLEKLLPLLFGFILILFAIALFIAFMDCIGTIIKLRSNKTETFDNPPAEVKQ